MSETDEPVAVRYRMGFSIPSVLGIGAALMSALLLVLIFLFAMGDRTRYDDLAVEVRASRIEPTVVLTAIGMRMDATGEESGRDMEQSAGLPQMEPNSWLKSGALAMQYTVDQLWERYDAAERDADSAITELYQTPKPLSWQTLSAILAAAVLALIIAVTVIVQSVRLRTGQGFIKEGE